MTNLIKFLDRIKSELYGNGIFDEDVEKLVKVIEILHAETKTHCVRKYPCGTCDALREVEDLCQK